MPAIACLFAGMARSYHTNQVNFAGDSTRKEYAVVVRG